MRTVCDNCNRRLDIESSQLGQLIRCPWCSASFTARPPGAQRGGSGSGRVTLEPDFGGHERFTPEDPPAVPPTTEAPASAPTPAGPSLAIEMAAALDEAPATAPANPASPSAMPDLDVLADNEEILDLPAPKSPPKPIPAAPPAAASLDLIDLDADLPVPERPTPPSPRATTPEPKPAAPRPGPAPPSPLIDLDEQPPLAIETPTATPPPTSPPSPPVEQRPIDVLDLDMLTGPPGPPPTLDGAADFPPSLAEELEPPAAPAAPMPPVRKATRPPKAKRPKPPRPTRQKPPVHVGRIALLVGSGALLLGGVGVGIAVHSKRSQGKAEEAAALATARRQLGDDTLAAYRKAATRLREIVDQGSRTIEPRGLEAQAHLIMLWAGVASEQTIADRRLAELGNDHEANPEVLKARALRALVDGKLSEAQTKLRAVLATASRDGTALVYLGWVHMASGDTALASNDFKQAVLADGERAVSQMGLGRAHEQAGDVTAALAAYRRAAALSPGHLGAAIAIERLTTHDPAALEARAEELRARLAPTSLPRDVADSWTLLGNAAVDIGRRADAEDRFKKAMSLDSSSMPAKIGLARMLCDSDQAATAIPPLQSVLRKQPRNLEALYTMVQAQLADKRPEQAAPFLATAEQIAPRAARTAFWRGRVTEAIGGPGSTDKAIADFRAAIESDPNLFDAYVMLAKLYREPNPAAATETLAKAEQQAVTPLLQDRLGEAYLSLGDFKTAERHFRQVIAKEPALIKTRMNLADALEQGGRLEEADVVLAELGAVHKRLPGVAERRAALAVRMQHLEQAAKLYATALAEPHPRASLMVAAGNVLFRLNRFDQARKLFDQAITDDPRVAGGYLGMARIALAEAKWDEAMFNARRSLSLAASPDAHLVSGQANEARGNQEAARSEYHEAAEAAAKIKNPIEFDARLAEARLLAKAGMVEDAKKALAVVTMLDPDRAEPLVLLGDCYDGLGQHHLALENYQQAVKRAPSNAEALFKLGRAEKDTGHPSVGARLLDQALELGGDKATFAAEASLLAGDAHREAGERPAAKRSYRRYLELAPATAAERVDVEQALRQLER